MLLGGWFVLVTPTVRPGRHRAKRTVDRGIDGPWLGLRRSWLHERLRATMEDVQRAELADFLRHRRASLRPADVGLAPGVRRRTPGLRREEVAQLVGMSADYYTRLEQRRGPQPSEQIIAAIARGLRLTLDERDHLFRLAGHHAPRRVLRSDHVSPPLRRVLDRLDTPALVLTDLGETLAQNPLSVALMGDHSRYSGMARSAVYRWFTDPAEREHYPAGDHAHQGRLQVAQLRAAVGSGGNRTRATGLVEALQAASPEFAELWARHEVLQRFEDQKVLRHAEVGEVAVDCQALFTEDQSQVLLVLTPTVGTDAAAKLELIGVLGNQLFVS